MNKTTNKQTLKKCFSNMTKIVKTLKNKRRMNKKNYNNNKNNQCLKINKIHKIEKKQKMCLLLTQQLFNIYFQMKIKNKNNKNSKRLAKKKFKN